MTANGIRHRERYDNRGKILLREKKQWRIICVPLLLLFFVFLRGLRSVDSASELIPLVSESSFLIKSS